MSVTIINPASGFGLRASDGGWLKDEEGEGYRIVNGVPRVCESSNYTENFG